MKKVLISIKPRWCEMIFNGKKTIEVRRTRPKLEPPFEVLVYCTMPKERWSVGHQIFHNDTLYTLPTGELKTGDALELRADWLGKYNEDNFLNGKVIGSFVCDEIYAFFPWGAGIACEDIDGNLIPALKVCEETCLTGDEIYKYLLGNGKETFEGYGWHIASPKLFDKPKELSEFGTVCNRYENDECDDCPYLQVYVNSYPCDDCVDTWCGVDNIKPLTRPPQSWCYIED